MSEGSEFALATRLPANDAQAETMAKAPVSAAELLAKVGDGLFEAMFSHAGPIYIASLGGKLIYANSAYQDIADKGGARNNLLPAHRRLVERVVEKHETFKLQASLATADGQRTYNIWHFPIYADNQVLVAVGATFADSTGEAVALARVQHEKQRFHDVIRATSDWVWETNDIGGLSFVSDRIIKVLGLPPMLLYGRALTAIGKFVAVDPHNGTQSAINARRPFRDAPFEIADNTSTIRRFHLSGVPVFDTTGRFLGYRGTATDVTARHAAEQAARQSRRELECALEELTVKNLQLDVALRKATAATQAKSEFLATMSHELRTPLNAIIGFSEVMHLSTFGALQPPYNEYAADILGASQHLLKLIDDILDIARIEGESIRLEIRPVPLARIVQEARTMIERRAADKNINIAGVTYRGDASVLVDETRALQVLLNVLGNAIKFTPNGGRVGLEVVDSGNQAARLVVWDTGHGIPPDKQELIFERFQQVHESILARSQEGIGLGLTLSRHLARLMLGDLTLDHSDKQGSRFAIALPLAPRPEVVS